MTATVPWQCSMELCETFLASVLRTIPVSHLQLQQTNNSGKLYCLINTNIFNNPELRNTHIYVNTLEKYVFI